MLRSHHEADGLDDNACIRSRQRLNVFPRGVCVLGRQIASLQVYVEYVLYMYMYILYIYIYMYVYVYVYVYAKYLYIH